MGGAAQQLGDQGEELAKELGVGVEVPLVCLGIGVFLVSGKTASRRMTDPAATTATCTHRACCVCSRPHPSIHHHHHPHHHHHH